MKILIEDHDWVILDNHFCITIPIEALTSINEYIDITDLNIDNYYFFIESNIQITKIERDYNSITLYSRY